MDFRRIAWVWVDTRRILAHGWTARARSLTRLKYAEFWDDCCEEGLH
jgi:hypothetical protein